MIPAPRLTPVQRAKPGAKGKTDLGTDLGISGAVCSRN